MVFFQGSLALHTRVMVAVKRDPLLQDLEDWALVVSASSASDDTSIATHDPVYLYGARRTRCKIARVPAPACDLLMAFSCFLFVS